jgi:hypothetical protein
MRCKGYYFAETPAVSVCEGILKKSQIKIKILPPASKIIYQLTLALRRCGVKIQ